MFSRTSIVNWFLVWLKIRLFQQALFITEPKVEIGVVSTLKLTSPLETEFLEGKTTLIVDTVPDVVVATGIAIDLLPVPVTVPVWIWGELLPSLIPETKLEVVLTAGLTTKLAGTWNTDGVNGVSMVGLGTWNLMVGLGTVVVGNLMVGIICPWTVSGIKVDSRIVKINPWTLRLVIDLILIVMAFNPLTRWTQ